MKHRRYLAPTVRDWSLTYWALIDGTKKLKGGILNVLGLGAVGVVVLALLLYVAVVLFWKWIVLSLIIILLVRLWGLHHSRTRPVPWDKDYDPRQDDDIPY